MDLKIEKMTSQADGILVTHACSKQRSDKKDSRFLVPSSGVVNYAAVIEKYLNTVKETLGVFQEDIFGQEPP